MAQNELDIVKAFEIGEGQDVKAEIKALADAINGAVNEPDQRPVINVNVTNQMPKADLAPIHNTVNVPSHSNIINVPEQRTPIVNVAAPNVSVAAPNVQVDVAAPTVNVAAPNVTVESPVTVQPADVKIDKPKRAKIQHSDGTSSEITVT